MFLHQHVFQVAMSRGYNPNIHVLGPRAAQPLELSLLQDAQELRLQLQWNVANFIQKQRSLVRQLNPANLLNDCTGKSAALVAKQFAFEQAAGNSSTIDLYERAVLAVAAIVNRTRDEFLAGSRLSQKEHGRIAWSHHVDEIQDLPERWTLPHDSYKVCPGTDFLFLIECLIRAGRSIAREPRVSGGHVEIRNVS